MVSADQIWEMYRRRKSERDPLINMMQEVTDYYEGKIVVPLPELSESEKPATANLVHDGIDQTAMRISSTIPTIQCPAVYPRKEKGSGSVEWANVRRGAIASWWEASRVQRLLRRRSRLLVAYGVSGAEVRPNFKSGIPSYHWLNPLSTFCAPTHEDDFEPADAIVAKRRTWEWLVSHYDASVLAPLWDRRPPEPDTLFTVLRYGDDEEFVVVVRAEEEAVASGYGSHHSLPSGLTSACVELSRVPNLAGICTVVQPENVTLGKLQGQFNQVLGLYDAQAQLMALDLIATRKGVFPDLALEGSDNRVPQLQDDEWKDGMSGEINVVQNGQVRVISLPPGFRTSESMDRLERAMRLSGGMPAQFGGEVPTNIRTGRANEIAMSAAIDFRIQEYQETLAYSLEAENKRAIAVAKGFFGDQSRSFHVGLPKMRQLKGDYTPNMHFETDANQVLYSMPGADVNTAALAVAQRVSVGTMSLKEGMRVDPLVEDPDQMMDEIQMEQLERAVFASIQEQANQGAIPLVDVARIQQLVMEDNMPLYQAVMKAQEEAQERQATEMEENDPGLQPGLSQPGMGVEGTPPAIPQAPQSMQNLRGILSGLRQPDSPRAGGQAPMARGASS